jgi:hypothetical protein
MNGSTLLKPHSQRHRRIHQMEAIDWTAAKLIAMPLSALLLSRELGRVRGVVVIAPGFKGIEGVTIVCCER